MIARFKLGIAIPQTNAPILETERLILRRWQEADIEPNTEMLADPVSARFITSDRKPVTDAFSGWRGAPRQERTISLVGATRFGVASAYVPGSKYSVYWALVVAGP